MHQWAASGPANTARREEKRSVTLAIDINPRTLASHLGEHAPFHCSTSTLLIRNLAFLYVILPKNPEITSTCTTTPDQAIDSPANHASAAGLRLAGDYSICVHVQVAHQRAQFLNLTLEPSDRSQNLRLNLRLAVRSEARGVV